MMETKNNNEVIDKILSSLKKLNRPVKQSHINKTFKLRPRQQEEIYDMLNRHDNVNFHIGIGECDSYSYSKRKVRKFYNITDSEAIQIAEIAHGGGEYKHFNKPHVYRFSSDGVDVMMITEGKVDDEDILHNLPSSDSTFPHNWCEIDRGLDVRITSNTLCDMLGIVQLYVDKGITPPIKPRKNAK